MPSSTGGLRWPRMPCGAAFEDKTAEARAARLARWLLARYRADGSTSLTTKDMLRDGPVHLRRVDRLDEALRLLATEGVLKVLRLGRRRWVQVDPIALSRGVPHDPRVSSAVAQSGDPAVRYFAMLGPACRKRSPASLAA